MSHGGTKRYYKVWRRPTPPYLVGHLLSAPAGAAVARRLAAADKVAPPRLPIAIHWSVELTTAVATAPVSDGDRVFLALRSAHLVARDVADGHELWRIAEGRHRRRLAADGGLRLRLGGRRDRGAARDRRRQCLAGRRASRPWRRWSRRAARVRRHRRRDPRDPRERRRDRLASAGRRRAQCRPTIDGDRLYVGRGRRADPGDGRWRPARSRWEEYVPGGVTALAARRGRVYAGAGDKRFYCLDARNGRGASGRFRVGSIVDRADRGGRRARLFRGARQRRLRASIAAAGTSDGRRR